MSSGSRASKRPRYDNGSDIGSAAEEAPLNLLALLQSDIGSKILSYASSVELCTLDILNKQFNALTTNQWNKITKDRFGMNSGKEGWKKGTAFLRPPEMINITDTYDVEGAPEVAANGSIILTVDCEANGIEVRDAFNFDHIRTLALPERNWRVCICGQEGSEIIVTSFQRAFYAQRGYGGVTQNQSLQKWQYSSERTIGDVASLGCETHLLVAVDEKLHIFEVNEQLEQIPPHNPELLSLRTSIAVIEGTTNSFDGIERSMAWGNDKTHFIVGYTHQICVWKFEKSSNNATLVLTITVNEFEVGNVSLSDDYIIASTVDKQIHIWSRSTGVKKVYHRHRPGRRVALCTFLCNEGDDGTNEQDIVFPLFLSCHGRILVSSNHVGCGICIWDMKTGQLLKRHDDPEKEEIMQKAIEVFDVVYLEHMNAFVFLKGGMQISVFPTSQRQSNNAVSRRQRHREERQNFFYDHNLALH